MGRDIVRQNATPTTGPSPLQHQAILALAGGASITSAAEAAGVDRSTIYRWLRDDAAFVVELNRAKRDHLDRVRGELRSLASDAVKALRDLVTSEATPPAVRLR